MDRDFLILSTICFLAAVVRTSVSLLAKNFHAGWFNFLVIGLGFIFQTAFLSIRGHALGRCPLTNLFEVFIFLAWSVALIYMLVGPAYRLSLMGAFTAPLVVLLQGFALLMPIDRPHPGKMSANPWLEFHASISLIAYGAFALGLHRGGDVSRAGAPTQDARVAFNLLPSSAANGSFCGHHKAALARLRALHARTGKRFFRRPTVAVDTSDLRDWGLGPLRRDLARQTSAPACAETCGRALHYWV